MNNVIKCLKCCFVILLMTAVCACEKEQLLNAFAKAETGPVRLSLAKKLAVKDPGSFKLNQSQLTIPVRINLSGVSSAAFTVQLTGSVDNLNEHISQNQLDPGTKGLENEAFSFPGSIEIPFGVSSFEFNIQVNRSFLEKYHGDNFATVIQLKEASKGNLIDADNHSMLLIINTNEIIAEESVHYISFLNADNPVIIGAGSSYTFGLQELSIPVALSLSGLASEAEFSVNVIESADVARDYVNRNLIPNLEVLDTSGFRIPFPKVKFLPGKNSATVEIAANVIAFLKRTGKKVAIGLELDNPTKFQLSKDKSGLVLILDPDYFRPYNGTPFVISGTVGKESNMIPFAEYDYGGPLVAYLDDAAKSGAASFRAEDMVDVADYMPRSVITGIVANEWLTYTVDVEADGAYEMNLLLGSTVATGRYSVFFNGVNVSGTLPVANSANIGYYIPNKSTVNLKKGRQIMRVLWNVAGFEARGAIFTRKN